MRSGGGTRGTAPLPSLQSNQPQPTPEIKDSVLNRQPARRKNRHRASILLSKDGFSRGKNTKATEEKLGEQFRYFRQEFLEAALSIGVPVPLDMVEDKAGRVYTFVNQKGPRYLFQIMHSNPESAHLLRVSLSLLIITISILRGKLPQNSSSMSSNVESSHLTWMNLLTENVSTWALDSLTSIADGSAVAICTNLLRHSHSQTIQELILNLLAQLVNITEEAANQMLLFPTITNTSSNPAEQGKAGSHDGKDVEGGSGGNESRSNSPLAMNRSLISSAPHDHSPHGLSPFPKSKRLSFASSVSSNSPHKAPKSHQANPSRLHSSSTGNHSSSSQFTCLSYMFSVVAHHRNRYTVMTASAEVVLALIANKSPAICEAIAKTAISSSLVEASDESRNNGSHSFGSTISSRILAVESAAKKSKKLMLLPNPSAASSSSQGAQWAALKLMLKFLQRFMRYATDSSPSTDHPHTASTEPASSPLKPTAPTSSDTAASSATADDGLPHQQKNSLCHAHSRVLLAVCELIIYSPVVASYVLSMPGARAIVKSSCLLHQSSSEIGSSVMGCLQVLQKESQRIFEQVSSHRHSLSYELTHGRSSKLFNPVAVLAKRDGPSPRLLSRPSTSSATGVGTTFGLPRTASQAEPSFHRCLSSRYSTSMNPFTTEFSLPSSPQPLSPHSPTPGRGGSGEYDPDRGRDVAAKGRVDILYVHHDTEDEGDEEGEGDVFDPDQDGGFDSHPNAGGHHQQQSGVEGHHLEGQEMKTNLPFLQVPSSQRHPPHSQSSSNQQHGNHHHPSAAPSWSNSSGGGGIKRSCSADGYDWRGDSREQDEEGEGEGGMNGPFDSHRFSLPEHKGEQQQQLGDPHRSAQEERKHSIASSASALGRNRIVYNPPESPPRRGLKDHQVGTEVSLHRDLFLSLPQKPAMPARLEAQDIINGHIPLANPASPALGQGDKFQYLEASMKQSLSISSDIVSSARQTGYYVNGKCSVPIVEKARRVYSPSRPRTAEESFTLSSSRLLPSSPIHNKHQRGGGSRGHGSPAETRGGRLDSSKLSTEPPAALKELKGVSLDGMGRLEQHTSHDYEMFVQQSSPSAPDLAQAQKLSQGFHHDQILQSYDVLFP